MSSAADRLFLGLIVGARCAHLFSGNDSYLVVPKSHGPDGWYGYDEFTVRGGPAHLVNLWHESMKKSDYELVTRVRDGGGTDWNELPAIGDRGGARTEFARFQYYDGKNPDWPAQCLRADYQQGADHIEGRLRDNRSVEQIIEDNFCPPQPGHYQGAGADQHGLPRPAHPARHRALLRRRRHPPRPAL